MSARRIIVVGGPTASGKSALALALAERDDVQGEIICADSRQLYAGMRVASAAPDDDERARVPHHLYETVAPEGPAMTAGAWAEAADAVIVDVQRRNRTPILVGGTGLYLRAWRIGLHEPSDPAVRARIDAEAALDLAASYARLRDVDPAAADNIEPTDRMRIVRALEIFEVAGRPRGAINPLAQPPRPIAGGAAWLLVDATMDVLERRIEARARRMFEGGAIVREARALEARVGPGHRLLATLGVAEALAAPAAPPFDAVTQTTRRTRQYARRQRTWFKKEPWWTRLDATSPRLLAAALDAVAGAGPIPVPIRHSSEPTRD